MKTIIVIPTYNERENISELIATIHQHAGALNLDILVVDSASPDKTAARVKEMQKTKPSLHLVTQPAKLGLGRAYLDGMRWVLERDYECLITMDADFSHHPRYLPTMLEKIKSCDLVIGSRYTKGGELRNWPLHRRLVSQFANWYARWMTGLPFTDLTSGFHCFRTELLTKIMRYRIHTEGYAFLMELKFLAILQGARYDEIPIIFSDRTKGSSKISNRVVLESMFFVWGRFFQRGRIKSILSGNSAKATHRKDQALV